MTMTFEQNWNNLVIRSQSMKNGIISQDIKDNHPLSSNFIKWANNNFEMIKFKLEHPGIDTPERAMSLEDYTNWMLQTSNKYLEKEGIFPVSRELTKHISNIAVLESLIKEDVLSILNGCVVCHQPKAEGNDVHCTTCDKLIEFADDPINRQSLLNNMGLVGKVEIKHHFENGYFRYERVVVSETETDYLASPSIEENKLKVKAYGEFLKKNPQVIDEHNQRYEKYVATPRKRIKYGDLSWDALQDEVYYSSSTAAKKEMDARLHSQHLLLASKANCTLAEMDGHIVPYSQKGTLERLRRERNRWVAEDKKLGTDDDEDTDEEDQESGEYYQEPEIIGDIDNPQFTGVDENGDDTYSDFDQDGHFLPMGNSNNSTDYQDDFDPQEYSGESWNSVDAVEDHHEDEYHYREVGITEQPVFITERYVEKEDTPWKNERMEWETESYAADVDEHLTPADDSDFVRDARNWLTRENLLRASEGQDEVIYRTYPVSREFLHYLEENEVDFETANQRLEEYLGIRRDGDEAKQAQAAKRYASGESMEDIAAALYMNISEVKQTLSQASF